VADAASAWDREAATFDREPDHGLRDGAVRNAWRTALGARLPPPPARIADLGCGTGSLSVLLAEDGHKVSGVDISAQMLAHARSKAMAHGVSLDLVRGDVAAPAYRAGAFDAIMCRHVLWALDDIDSVLHRWTGLLRSGGTMILIEGQWSTGGGLVADRITNSLRRLGRPARVQSLAANRDLWGREINDDRYMIVS